MANQFNNVAPLRPGRSVFRLDYEKKFNCDMGMLIPVTHDHVVPGDRFTIGNECVIRWQPLIKPILHEVNVFIHYFFVPYRLMWDNSKTDSWEAFITGGPDGSLEPTLPVWEGDTTTTAIGSLWDYMGLPTGITPTVANGNAPEKWPKTAYNFIFNEYYRDQTLQDEVDLDSDLIQFRAWMKDYFTSALPWQQRGDPPSLPIAGTTSAAWNNDLTGNALILPQGIGFNTSNNKFAFSSLNPDMVQFQSGLNDNTVDLSTATTFDIADLRQVVQIQKFLERNARAGVRYTEFLGAHFGVKPNDARLDRPEYIGGTKSPVIISEVLQTSASASDVFVSDTPQANLAGHGITASREFAGKYRVTEFGIIMGIMSVMPKPAYQQGINRQWLHETKYDFYFPEFAHLSEQGIFQKEIYASDVLAENNTLFGYQGKYDHMRVKENLVCGTLRSQASSSLDYWHLARDFSAAPILDPTFISTGDPTKATGQAPSGTFIRKNIFSVQDEYTLIVNFGNKIKAIRPMPSQSNPGLMDHF